MNTPKKEVDAKARASAKKKEEIQKKRKKVEGSIESIAYDPTKITSGLKKELSILKKEQKKLKHAKNLKKGWMS